MTRRRRASKAVSMRPFARRALAATPLLLLCVVVPAAAPFDAAAPRAGRLSHMPSESSTGTSSITRVILTIVAICVASGLTLLAAPTTCATS